MEKRLGTALIVVKDPVQVPAINQILTLHSEIILGRQGIPLRERNTSIISIVLEGTTDQIGALTGKLGRIRGVMVKSVLTPEISNDYERP